MKEFENLIETQFFVLFKQIGKTPPQIQLGKPKLIVDALLTESDFWWENQRKIKIDSYQGESIFFSNFVSRLFLAYK